MPQYRLAVDENCKATELPILRVCGSVRENPHMRAFWGATISFFLAFLGWFALAPLALDVATSMGICENQLFPPMEHPERAAYVSFKNLKSGKPFCKYGTVEVGVTEGVFGGKVQKACKPSPLPACEANATGCATEEERVPYDLGALKSAAGKELCICTAGTQCKNVLADAGVLSVASTVFARVLLGTLLERFGPVNVQCGLLSFGAIWVFAAAGISAPWNYMLIRFMIGAAGATFVTNQFWSSLMFAPNVVGTANATAAGWGNLGGGVTQIFMVVVLFNPLQSAGLSSDEAWRTSMVVPGVLFLACAAMLKLLCWDTPTKKRFETTDTGKAEASLWDYVEVLKDFRVWVMIFQYSACFGTELAMNNQLATHFRTYFQMKAADAAALASAFGLMNLFARSLGGIFSDAMFAKVGFRGRIWAQFLALFFEACFLFGFGQVDNTQPWWVALTVLVFFSLFVQMAEGTSYGIVPFMNKKHLAIVSAVVGAGGNLGAVIAGFCFYKPIDDALLPFRVHAGYVMFWALLSPVYYWPEYGGMFWGPAAKSAYAVGGSDEGEGKASEEVSRAPTGSTVAPVTSGR